MDSSKRPVQYFTDDYLKQCQKMTPLQIVKFLEDFRELHLSLDKKEDSVSISIRMPKSLLQGLKQKAKLEGKAYQTLLKEVLKKAI